MKTTNHIVSIDDVLLDLHKSHFDTIDGTDGCAVSISQATTQIDQLINSIIGENEYHQDTSFGGSLPKFETTSMAYRNSLRDEQRSRLQALLSDRKDTK